MLVPIYCTSKPKLGPHARGSKMGCGCCAGTCDICIAELCPVASDDPFRPLSPTQLVRDDHEISPIVTDDEGLPSLHPYYSQEDTDVADELQDKLAPLGQSKKIKNRALTRIGKGKVAPLTTISSAASRKAWPYDKNIKRKISSSGSGTASSTAAAVAIDDDDDV